MSLPWGRQMADSKRRLRQRGRKSDHSYLGIPHYILRSQEFGRLEPWALKLLIELAAKYNGANNGDLSAAFSVLCKRGWNSPGTLNSAIKHLLTSGWLARTRHGGKNRCALYAITWWPINHCDGKWLEIKAESVARHSWKTVSVVGTCSNVVGSRSNGDVEEAA